MQPVEEHGAVQEPARLVYADTITPDKPGTHGFLQPQQRRCFIPVQVILHIGLKQVPADGLIEGIRPHIIRHEPGTLRHRKDDDTAAAPVPIPRNELAQHLADAGSAEVIEGFLRKNKGGTDLFRLKAGQDQVLENLLEFFRRIYKGLFHADRTDIRIPPRIIAVHCGNAVPSQFLLAVPRTGRGMLFEESFPAALEFLKIPGITEGIFGKTVVGFKMEIAVLYGKYDALISLCPQGAVEKNVLLHKLQRRKQKPVPGTDIVVIRALASVKIQHMILSLS